MNHSLFIECGSLYGVLGIFVALLFLVKPKGRGRVALLFSFCWAFALVPLGNAVAEYLGYWRLDGGLYSSLGMPLSLWLSWAIGWGPVAGLLLVLLHRHLRSLYAWSAVLGIFVLLDIWLMPLMRPLVVLNSSWLIGELMIVSCILMPALLLMHSTWLDCWLIFRVVALAVIFTSLVYLCLPLSSKGLDFREFAGWLQSLQTRQISFMWMAGLCAIPGVWAVWDLAMKGKGTPVPLDPPKCLVTDGVYRFVKSPMQISTVLSLGFWAAALESFWLGVSVFVCVVYSYGFARWSEREELTDRFGDKYEKYSKGKWL